MRCTKLPATMLVLIALTTCCATASMAAGPLEAGLHDVVVYDAGAHEAGLPGVDLREIPGGQEVDIPPSVHVHRYYYSGDKEIQGPIVAGGPVIVVAKHPKTGKQMYVDVTLPAGAPRIAYHRRGITYVYDHQRVSISFQHWPLDPEVAAVKYHKGRGVGRVAYDVRQHTKQRLQQSLRESSLAKSVKTVAKGSCDVAAGGTEAVETFASGGIDFFKSAIGVIPGVAQLKSMAEQRPERQVSTSLQQKAQQNLQQATSFFRTNR